MPTALETKREELATKQKALGDILEEAKTDNALVLDLKKVTKITGDEAQKAAEIKRRNEELKQLHTEVELFLAQERVEQIGKMLNAPVAGGPPVPGAGVSAKSLGELFIESKAFKDYRKGSDSGPVAGIDLEAKAVMTTAAGWAPQAIRTGRVIESAQRPIQVLDMLPSGETTQNSVVFMEETTFTNNAAEAAEGAASGQATLILTQRNSPVQTVAVHLPITDEQLEDIPQVSGYVDNRLTFMVRQRLDGQSINGNGVAPNLTGFLNVAGIQTQARGADPQMDAIYKAILSKLFLVGRVFADGIVMHPTDWQGIRLTRTADGIYIYGSPSEAGPTRLWGLPVGLSDALAAGTALVGAFQGFTELTFRRGIDVQIGFNNDDFTKRQKTVRADLRAALPVYRPAALCTVTGL